jgi:hypothetical protein
VKIHTIAQGRVPPTPTMVIDSKFNNHTRAIFVTPGNPPGKRNLHASRGTQ